MQRVYEENEWGKVSKRIVTTVGSSPSGFTTRKTKVHVVCESKLNNWQSGLGNLETILVEPAKFIPRYFVKKVATTQKKVLKLGIQKVVIF